MLRIENGVGNPFSKYMLWLHTHWPAGVVEKLPVTGPDRTTNIPGVRIVGDPTGIPLLKLRPTTARLHSGDSRPMVRSRWVAGRRTMREAK